MNTPRTTKPGLLAALLWGFLLAGCSNNDVKPAATSDPQLENLYLSYKISAEEGGDWVTCLVQVKKARNGKVVPLPRGAQVLLDGEPLVGDSAGVSGAYYEIQKPLEEFVGEHTFVLKGAQGATYETPFTFSPITLLTDLGGSIRRQDLPIRFQGIEQDDLVQIAAIDTSFASNDINKETFANENAVSISELDWQNLKNGPIIMDIVVESATPLRHTEKGGRLVINYSMKRDFILRD